MGWISRATGRMRVAAGLIIVMAIGLGVAAWRTGVLSSDAPYVLERPSPAEISAVSLNEAWDLVWAEAAEWNPDARLVDLNAMGAYEPADPNAGSDGRRRYWLALFDADDSTLLVQLFDGQVVRVAEQPGSIGGRTITERPAVDSTAAVPRAVAGRPGFEGASGDVNGFGIGLSIGEDDRPVITIVGRYHERPARAKVDPVSGSVLSWERLIPQETGGIWHSRDAGQSWQPSDLLDIGGAAISGPARGDGTGYAVVNDVEGVDLYHTVDGGASWRPIGRLPSQVGHTFFHLAVAEMPGSDVLLLSSSSGLWISRDTGSGWSLIAELPPGPASWLGVADEGDRIRVFASVGSGADLGIYTSTDLSLWTLELPGNYRLSGSYDHRQVLATVNAALPVTTARILGVDGSAGELILPEFVSNAAGAFDGSGPLVIQTHDKIRFSDDGGMSWRTTYEGEGGIVVAAPDFADSGRLLGSTPGSGLLLSDNGGATWQPLQTNQSAVSGVSAQTTLGGPEFLSRYMVVAREFGRREWRPF